MQKENIHEFRGGLHQDNIPENQPQQTLRFALNSVKETQLGNKPARSVEEANEIYASLKEGYTPIGKVYIGSNRLIIFSVSQDNTVSEIGLLDDNETYTALVNDSASPVDDKLNFKVEYQIDAIYRLRRGCDETIYFTDNLNPPRYFNISQPEDFQDPVTKNWVARSFDLIRSFNKIPEVANVEVLNNQGTLTPGSYSIMIQYLDDDFNGTTFLTEIPNINIYNDSTNDQYNNINGSTNIGTSQDDPYNYEDTNKAIKVTYTNFDESYNFFRLAIIRYTNNLGTPTEVRYTDPISIRTNTFIYTGENATTQGSLDELILSNSAPVVLKAKNINQFENRLILSNTTGQEVQFCKLQRYASRIKADCVVKDSILTTLQDDTNPKNPLVRFNGVSYQPGEAYSFGIMYVFDDMSTTPVYHIPGKNPNVDEGTIYSPGENVFPMSKDANFNSTEFYTDNSSCTGNSYWGLDSEGEQLLGANVRHHRFPTRNSQGIGFVKREAVNENAVATYNKLRLDIIDNIRRSVTCAAGDTGCTPYDAIAFRLVVRYKEDGEDRDFEIILNPDSQVLPYYDGPIYLASATITDIKLFYRDSSAPEVELPLDSNGETIEQANGGRYRVSVQELSEDQTLEVYSVPIFGIKFSGVELPPESVIGKRAIGYYIVRQERREIDRTILDSGVVIPLTKNNNFVTSGLLAPEFDGSCEEETYNRNFCYRTSKRNFQIISPLHKFSNETFDGFSSIEEQGKYRITSQSHSGLSYQNVYDGSSADGVDTNESTSDDDGMSLRHIIRSTKVEYALSGVQQFNTTNEDTTIYNLQAANYVEHSDNTETIYNLASDNTALIFSKSNDEDLRTYRPGRNEYPYVYIKSNNSTFYANFRVNPYYKQTVNLQTADTIEVFGGDTYISPMRYSNHIYANSVAGTRRESLSFLEAFVAVLVIIVGVALSIFSGGSSLVIAGGILTALAGVALGAAAIVEVERFNDIYNDKWNKGLDKTVFDKFYHYYMWNSFALLNPAISSAFGVNIFDPLQWRDDTFKWYGDVLGDLWFETPINMSLRVVPRNNQNNFLQPLKPFMQDRPDKLASLARFGENDDDWDFQDDYFYYRDVTISAEGEVENFFLKKITTPDPDRRSGVKYTGLSIPQIYLLNTDHNVQTNIQEHFHLALSYDCCSNCNETFPHRWHWSEQSFQEELTDNYRTFLPNNYRDISGETGEITNVFSYRNNLYIHTREGLWLQPRQHQERVTDQIVSFIGTGEFGSIPPRMIVEDDTGNTAGTQHKWSTIRTVHGYFFISEAQGKAYLFDGQNLKAISNIGLNTWFKDNTRLLSNQQYYKSNSMNYQYNDNPSNPFGVGFITTYDSNKERILFTKRDFSFIDGVTTSTDFNVCTQGGDFIQFDNFNQTIQDEAIDNFIYQGLEDCRMKFEKEITRIKQETRTVRTVTTVPNTADIHVFFDTSGSFGSINDSCLSSINIAVDEWITSFAASNPDWTGNVFKYNDATERWVAYAQRIATETYSGQDLSTKDIIVLSFCNEADTAYHSGSGLSSVSNPTATFINDYNSFLNLHGQYKSFLGIHYPIVFGQGSGGCGAGGGDLPASRVFLMHSIAALYGVELTSTDIAAELATQNLGFSTSEWNTMLTSLQTNNPYPNDGLRNYGWIGKWDRRAATNGAVISAQQFQDDIQELLLGSVTVVTEEVTKVVNFIDVETKFIDGTVVQNPVSLRNDWTMSFSIKDNEWLSWHSYIPNFYASVPEKFYSWRTGNRNIWRHNVKGKYRTFYGEEHPHIIEYVIIVNPINNYITNHLKLITRADVYDEDTKEFYEDRNTTFNKLVVYNNRQCSGELNLLVKEEQNLEDWFTVQTDNANDNSIIIDRTEDTWYINDLRDLRTNYSKPIWNSTITARNENYYIDKVLNEETLSQNKDWFDLESFRGKHLVVRYIFDKFVDRKLITNFSVENEQESHY